jgi:hypothetical protein
VCSREDSVALGTCSLGELACGEEKYFSKKQYVKFCNEKKKIRKHQILLNNHLIVRTRQGAEGRRQEGLIVLISPNQTGERLIMVSSY